MATVAMARSQEDFFAIENSVFSQSRATLSASTSAITHADSNTAGPRPDTPGEGPQDKLVEMPPVDATPPSFLQLQPYLVLEPQNPGTDKFVFDAEKHLSTETLPKVYTMEELGLADEKGVSPIGVSEAFSLFSFEAIEAMRSEILCQEVFDNHHFQSNASTCQLRGFAPKHTPFVYDAFTHPKTLSIISRIAGLDLVPVMNYELGHVNISVKTEEEQKAEIQKYQEAILDQGYNESRDPVVDWHNDSYPFVCVIMLSDARDMIGGETALCTGTGEIVKVRGPQKGSAVIMQGRYIHHKALQSIGVAERITLVVSFRPKDPGLPDDTVLSTVRGISNLGELYEQYAEYRLEIVEERIRRALKNLRTNARAHKQFNTANFKAVVHELVSFLQATDNEMVNDHLVPRGHVPLSIPTHPLNETCAASSLTVEEGASQAQGMPLEETNGTVETQDRDMAA
ncbi:MAG: hypothetical protein M1814_004737 [Vezdaea aestivalis]|nr:MAG: hypothetical protein M1814_004737 [Vezdaea aestivalis]